jgi:hypothetical protein
VDPVPNTQLLRRSLRAGNRTRDLCICSQESVTTRPQSRSVSTVGRRISMHVTSVTSVTSGQQPEGSVVLWVVRRTDGSDG